MPGLVADDTRLVVQGIRRSHDGALEGAELYVNGVEIETLHPGPAHMLGLRHDMLSLLMSLFPHKTDFDDFGAMRHPRLRLRDLDLFAAA